MSRYRLAKLAQRDLAEIRAYIAADKPAAADRQIEKFADVFQLLAKQPLMGEERSDLRPNLRLLSVGTYVVCFYPMSDGVQIARILEGHRDITRLFRRKR
jgi:toxin ParE1/3/4